LSIECIKKVTIKSCNCCQFWKIHR